MIATPNFKTPSRLSRDRRFIAFSENDPTTRWDLWVLSAGPGGEQPRWRGDGKEIFFVGADGKLYAVAKGGLWAQALLFDAHIVGTPINMAFQYDVTADGKRFLVNTTKGAGSAPPLTVVVNWDAASKN